MKTDGYNCTHLPNLTLPLIIDVFLNTNTAIIDEDDEEISFNLKEGTPILIVNKETAKKRKILEESQNDSMIDIVSELQ